MKLLLLLFILWASPSAQSQLIDVADIVPETPVEIEPFPFLSSQSPSRPWRPPVFSSQNSSLGYQSSDFEIPELLKTRVEFWIDIYTKYTTHEGILHDTEDMNAIFTPIDFRPLEKDTDLTSRQLRKKKEKLVEDEKNKIVERILAAMKNTDTETLSDSEKVFWSYAKDMKTEIGMNLKKIKKRIRFQLGQKDRFEQAIFLSGRYLEEFEKIFRDQGLPIELTRIVFVESSFNVMARSKVGASGLWQIMPSTARPYRMLKGDIDYRNDPYEATKMAARVFRMGYDLLGSWPLAITGYNHGPAGMKKLTQKYKTQDLPTLIENAKSRKSFGFASKNFYSSFLAALTVERDANKYFKNPNWSLVLPVTPTRIDRAMNRKEILEIFDQNKEMIEVSNPHLAFSKGGKNRTIPTKTLIYFPNAKKAEIEKMKLIREPSSENHESNEE